MVVQARLQPIPDTPTSLWIKAEGLDRPAIVAPVIENLGNRGRSLSIQKMHFVTYVSDNLPDNIRAAENETPHFTLVMTLEGKPVELRAAFKIATPGRLFEIKDSEIELWANAPLAVRSATLLGDWQVEIGILTDDEPGIVRNLAAEVIRCRGSFVHIEAQTKLKGFPAIPEFSLNCRVVCPSRDAAKELRLCALALRAGKTRYRVVRARVIEPLCEDAA